jgi:hypothetical protein
MLIAKCLDGNDEFRPAVAVAVAIDKLIVL